MILKEKFYSQAGEKRKNISPQEHEWGGGAKLLKMDQFCMDHS